MELEESTVGNACIAAYKRMLAEASRFRAAQVYFLKLELGALRDGGLLKEAHDEFVDKLKPEYDKPSRYFLERSFILLVAAFELFLQDVLTAIITTNPKKVGQTEFKLSEILDSAGTDELVRRSIEATLNKLMYKKPLEYLTDITELLSIDPTPLREKWPLFAEAKARRDLGVHNGWKCNSIYLRKVHEAGVVPTYTAGQSTSPAKDSYFSDVMDSLTDLAYLLMEGVLVKHAASLKKPHK